MMNACEPGSLNNSEKSNINLKGLDPSIEQLEGRPSERLNSLHNGDIGEPPAQHLALGIESPLDGGYGWVCVAACFTINCFTWGVVSSYGVFLGYYLANGNYPDATPMDFAFIGGLNFSIAMLVSPLVTLLARRHGIHLPMVIGISLQTTGFITASFATRIWHLYLTQGFLVGAGVGFIYIPSLAILSQWFHKRRSLANGISAAGSGIGGLIFSFLVRATMSNISVAWSLRITGILSGFMNVLATAAIRSRNHIIQPKQHPFDTLLLRRYDVVLILAWAFVSMLGYITLLFSMSNFASSIGLDDSQAATVTALLNLGTALGRPFIGVISDHFGRVESAGCITFLCAISVFAIWLPANSYGVTIFFVIVNGAILGVFWVTIGPICAEVVGLQELPSVLSLTWLMIVLPTTFSEVIALRLRRSGSGHEFLYPQIFAGLMYFAASLISLELWRVHRRSPAIVVEMDQVVTSDAEMAAP